MNYKLTKLSIKEGAYSQVGVGQSARGSTIKVIREVTPDEIKKGDEVYVGSGWSNYIKTSPLERIEKNLSGNYTMWTQTSTYHIDIYTEEDDDGNSIYVGDSA